MAGGLAAAQPALAQAPRLTIDDASRLNATPVASRAAISQATDFGAASLRECLASARAAGRPLLVAGARHSMGGQSIPRHGDALTLSRAPMQVDRAARTYRVGAGATWGEVIAGLAPHGLSPAVTQSNNDFAVGGAISVNAHGWAVPYGGVASSVRRLTVMLASGEVVECSRVQNAELFSLCLGGYGLFAAILQAELEAVDDEWLRPSRTIMPAAAFGARFAAVSREAGVRMAYGRLSMAQDDSFLGEAQLTVYRPDRSRRGNPPSSSSAGGDLGLGVAQGMFRAQVGSDAMKRLRWGAETLLLPLADGAVGRNQLINNSVSILGRPPAGKTDILHEYFLPPDALEPFLAACRRLLRGTEVDLLNITLRYLAGDPLTALAYAPGERIAAVMFFNQPITGRGERAMRALTEKLIDAALDCGGGFYLPYRLHASRRQIERAYPRIADVLAAKRRLDPNGVFRSLMWDRYFAERRGEPLARP